MTRVSIILTQGGRPRGWVRGTEIIVSAEFVITAIAGRIHSLANAFPRSTRRRAPGLNGSRARPMASFRPADIVVMEPQRVTEQPIDGPSAAAFRAHCAFCLGCERE